MLTSTLSTVPVARLQLEVDFASVAEVEQFWAAIPAQLHRAWSQRMQVSCPDVPMPRIPVLQQRLHQSALSRSCSITSLYYHKR